MFGEEISGLYDDGFEGSTSEHHIFKEIFYENDEGPIKKRCFGAAATDIEAKQTKHANRLGCSNSENSVMTCQSSTKDSYLEDSCPVYDGFVNVKNNQERVSGLESGCVTEGSSWGQRNVADVNCSVDKHSVPEDRSSSECYPEKNNLDQLECIEEVAPEAGAPDSCNVDEILRCNLVESSSQSIISSFFLLEGNKKVDKRGHPVGKVPKVKTSDLLARNGEEDTECTDALQVSHQGIPSEIVLGGACTARNSETIKDANGGSEESVLLNTDMVNGTCKRSSKKDPRPRLRHHLNQLFTAMGWNLDKRKRNGRNYQENVYIDSNGKPFYELHKAWRSIGESLFVGKAKSKLKLMQEENAKQWDNINELWV
ncbi:hypothetical protein AQUCO_05500007v1 [Aquilegia coerulea]|uniref:Uncharacterized protein n=1 Tax=Aquilegia coerulea TaxID=218851 RepID=A0A2G5CGR9_AQUCA|nr:hypothetical protein AQUCO_05500007v1 [Aquilegia coerulea]